MDRAQASAIAHRWHPIAAPVTGDNLRLLIQRLGLPPDGRILDLGCGFGEWLFAALEAAPGTTAVGVDTSGPALQEARARAAARNLAGRVTFEQADASGWSGEGFDAVLCIGATHAFGGLAATLAAVRAHLRPSSGCCSARGTGRRRRARRPSGSSAQSRGSCPTSPAWWRRRRNPAPRPATPT